MRFDRARTHASAFTVNQPVKVHACVCVTFRLGILDRSNADVGHGNVLIGITRNVTRSQRTRPLHLETLLFWYTAGWGYQVVGCAAELRQLPTTLLIMKCVINSRRIQLVPIHIGYKLHRYTRVAVERGVLFCSRYHCRPMGNYLITTSCFGSQ